MTHLQVTLNSVSLSPDTKAHKSLDVSLNRYSNDLQVNLHARSLCVVLTVTGIVGKGEAYLQVTPSSMWITTDMIQELFIKSNVDWVIT